ncbi:MAG: c-type cytochrome [Rhodobacteraceae bacterium]|nr:c-type cytochrome [Paracoccaceae bacterium]
MHPTISGPAVRHALSLALTLAVGAIPSLATGAADAIPPAGSASAGAGQALLVLAQAQPAEHPVSFAPEQADRGKRQFLRDCTDCHGDDLEGGLNGGPPLKGVQFNEKFGNGAPASALFSFMSTLMPPDSPGRFSADAYADMMAYILKLNGYQPGAPLPSDLDALDYVIMEK